ncbi:phosphotransferase [Arthrobacter sp. M4]|uniref:phosphotransferase n=1 Tax=Arthrobacter sp. M4 TaxID=218160 RepID=UPI001CDC95BB|nr:phosphotransferase [Arthrobacter sp. M4]MCA4135033.1 aminoglycoside phosphotransferase family protein [Arthrobacter sp. M4]
MNFVDDVLHDRYWELGLYRYDIGADWETVLLTPRFVTSRHLVALIFPRGFREPRLVVKVPRQPGDNLSVRHEAAVMAGLKALGLGAEQGIPEVVSTVDVGDHTVLIETAVRGIPLDPRHVAADLKRAVKAGSNFVDALPCTAEAGANSNWYQRTVVGPLRRLVELLPMEPEVVGLVERTHHALEPLQGTRLPAVVEHGDLSHPNLFLRPNGTLQVVDWERSRTDGVPGHDLVFYLQYLSESHEQAYERIPQLVAFDKAFGRGGWALQPLRSHLELRGVDPQLLPLLVLATWARSTATLAYRLTGAATLQGKAHTRDAVLADRDYWLWRHAMDSWELR